MSTWLDGQRAERLAVVARAPALTCASARPTGARAFTRRRGRSPPCNATSTRGWSRQSASSTRSSSAVVDDGLLAPARPVHPRRAEGVEVAPCSRADNHLSEQDGQEAMAKLSGSPAARRTRRSPTRRSSCSTSTARAARILASRLCARRRRRSAWLRSMIARSPSTGGAATRPRGLRARRPRYPCATSRRRPRRVLCTTTATRRSRRSAADRRLMPTTGATARPLLGQSRRPPPAAAGAPVRRARGRRRTRSCDEWVEQAKQGALEPPCGIYTAHD